MSPFSAIRRVCAVLPATLCVACGNEIFYTDFESQTAGAPPEVFPAGPPTGDRIDIEKRASTFCDVAPARFLEPAVGAIVQDDAPILGERSLTLLHQRVLPTGCPDTSLVPPHGDTTVFRHAGHVDIPFDDVSIGWIGRAQATTDITFVIERRVFSDDRLAQFDEVIVHLKGGQVFVSPQQPGQSLEKIGYLEPDTAHLIRLSFAPNGSYAFSALGSGPGVPGPDASASSIFSSEIAQTTAALGPIADYSHIELRLLAMLNTDPATSGSYDMDQVRITHE